MGTRVVARWRCGEEHGHVLGATRERGGEAITAGGRGFSLCKVGNEGPIETHIWWWLHRSGSSLDSFTMVVLPP